MVKKPISVRLEPQVLAVLDSVVAIRPGMNRTQVIECCVMMCEELSKNHIYFVQKPDEHVYNQILSALESWK